VQWLKRITVQVGPGNHKVLKNKGMKKKTARKRVESQSHHEEGIMGESVLRDEIAQRGRKTMNKRVLMNKNKKAMANRQRGECKTITMPKKPLTWNAKKKNRRNRKIQWCWWQPDAS
jgi:hypothetical protein